MSYIEPIIYEKGDRIIEIHPTDQEIIVSVTHRVPLGPSSQEGAEVRSKQSDETEETIAESDTAITSSSLEKIDNTEYLVLSTKASFPIDEAEDLADFFTDVAQLLNERFVWPNRMRKAKLEPEKRIPYIH